MDYEKDGVQDKEPRPEAGENLLVDDSNYDTILRRRWGMSRFFTSSYKSFVTVKLVLKFINAFCPVVNGV